MIKVKLSASVKADLSEALAFYRAPSRMADAVSYTSERAARHIERWPYSGHRRRDLSKADICFWFEDPYFLVFLIKGDTLFIVAFLHSARNIPPILRNRLKRKPL